MNTSLPSPTPLLEIRNLSHHYTQARTGWWDTPARVEVLRDIQLRLQPGRSLGLVGESGAGKSTLARLVMALDVPSCGQVLWQGQDLHALSAQALRQVRPQFQMVFQDPYSALNPRHTVLRIITEPLRVRHAQGLRLSESDMAQRSAEVLEQVGLQAGDLHRYPHEFSGGQRQRIAIARALITRPQLIVADEPVSALDVSVQAQVLNLLQDLQNDLGISLLLISHDFSVIKHLCHDTAVLHAGRIVEYKDTESLLAHPQHPYTQSLLQALTLVP